MDDEIKNYVDKLLLTKSIRDVINDVRKLLKDSEDRRKYFLKNNKDLGNIPGHIEMCKDIISYLVSMDRDRKLSSIFEKRILNFKEFLKKSF
jgi:hypothetical protein